MKKVMVVDDEPDVLGLYSMVLKKLGYEYAGSKGGKESLEQAETFEPNLILMDIMMPEMDGYEACRKIKENMCPSAPYIYLFSNKVMLDDEELEKAIEESSADGFIPKRSDLRDIKDFLECFFESVADGKPLCPFTLLNEFISVEND